MSDLFWLTYAQMARFEPFFPKSHGKPRVYDRRVLSGIIFINRNGLRWWDAPAVYEPHKTLYSRRKHWSDKGIFACMMAGLAAEHGEKATVMLDEHRSKSSDSRIRLPRPSALDLGWLIQTNLPGNFFEELCLKRGVLARRGAKRGGYPCEDREFLGIKRAQ